MGIIPDAGNDKPAYRTHDVRRIIRLSSSFPTDSPSLTASLPPYNVLRATLLLECGRARIIKMADRGSKEGPP
jgi:hypothetical protein